MLYHTHRTRPFLLPLLLAGLMMAGCDSTEPDDDAGEEELITRVVLSLVETGSSARTITVTAEDTDGDGVLDTIETLTLTAGEAYDGSIALFNDLEDPPEDITEEVEEEDFAHQFQYTVTDATGVTVTDLDLDRNNLPLGLTFTIEVADDATASGRATLQVVLRHYDEAGPDSPTPKQNDTGENDVQVDFPLVVADQDLAELRGDALDRFRGTHIGIVFQEMHLLPTLMVEQNLLLAPYLAGLPQDPARVREVLQHLDVADKAGAYPDELSMGQRQRVGIARAVMNRPRLLLADEPTSSLDDVRSAQVLDLLVREAETIGATLIITSHDQRVKQRFERRLELAPSVSA